MNPCKSVHGDIQLKKEGKQNRKEYIPAEYTLIQFSKEWKEF